MISFNTMHCREAGEGLALVLIHGYLGCGEQWRSLVKSPPPGMRVIAPSLPGFGHSADLPPPQSIPEFARVTFDFLSARKIDRFALLGHSMGGMIAQEMTAQAPRRITALILYATGAIGEIPGRFETIQQSRERLKADGATKSAKRIPAKWLVGQENSPHYPLVARLACKAQLPAQLAGLAAMESWNGADALPRILCPTLIIWGEQDISYPRPQIDLLHAKIPNAQLKTIPNTSHLAHLEAPDTFNTALRDFLQSV